MSIQKEKEYREIFLAEALENYTEINRLLTALEKSVGDLKVVQALFRLTHTLKGNATGMGYEKIAEMAHVMEDFFGEVRDGRIVLGTDIFTSVFKSADVLGQLIDSIKTQKDVKYRGIKTKLEVLIKAAKQGYSLSQPNGQSQSKSELVKVDPSEENEMDADSGESVVVSFSDLVQVPVKKLDDLLDLVGELVIERDRIIANNMRSHSTNEFSRLNRISSDLQYSVMDVRLVQVGFLFNKFHRIVRDASTKESKHVMLKLEGSETEIDRNILQVISDSLIHLIRNAIGHGIERPEQRKQNGKPEEGTVTLSASSESDTVIIKIKDDGVGIDPQRIKNKAIERGLISLQDAALMTNRDLTMLIFEPGFSTIDEVTAISGRGVGMDVVKKAIDSVGGTVAVDSMIGEGTIFTLTLPSSMAVKSTLLFELGSQTYAIPLSYTESVISIFKSDIHKTGNELITIYLNKTIHIVFLSDLFDPSYDKKAGKYKSFDKLQSKAKLEVVVVSFGGNRIGFIVDKLLQQKEIVEKPLKKPFDSISFLSGVTILGNGNVCLALSIPGVLNALFNSQVNRTINA
ncbi:chemotaxis protein CheA [Chryseolinea sp. H1M3-3]|uniref:chemotaxis protein CheA n=1 Tax=Chryseolinea sp. H1M3-3 TaxID=3034144 RepID=UPI0023EE146D|nr:chemotaxis protein CheA [Chryseolinea sp. H1M3-3]